MDHDDSRVDPRTADVVDHDTYQPFARRSARALFGIVLALVLVGLFTAWYFFGGGEAGRPERQEASLSREIPDSRYAEGSGRDTVYDFFFKVFGAAEEGLDESPHNLQNVEQVGQFNIDEPGALDEQIDVALFIDQYSRAAALQNRQPVRGDPVLYAFDRIMGAEVYDEQNNPAGTIYDILIHKKTGEAREIIINNDEALYRQDLASVRFKDVFKQEPEGDIRLAVTEQSIETRPEFNYTEATDEMYVSLRHLRDGQIIDHNGEPVGAIEALIYQDAEVQNIFFTLRPLLARHGPSFYQLALEEAQSKKRKDGYDIQLTEEQTENIAHILFEDTRPASGQRPSEQNQ